MTHLALLFDLDGVIVDTAKYHYLAWKEIADELGIKFTITDNELLKGVSRNESFDIILRIGEKKLTEVEKERICEKKNDLYLNYINQINEDEILPGVKAFINQAREQGYKIALGSASKNSVVILKRLKLVELFDEIIDGTKVSKAKPDPEVFQEGANKLNIPFEKCIVFEDSMAGIKAAHSCNMQVVGIGSKELLPEADINIPGFEHITIKEIETRLNKQG